MIHSSVGPATRAETIAEAILASRALLGRYLIGFDDHSHTRQAPNLPNHLAWCLGHCALTLHRGLERITGDPVPERDFLISPIDLAERTASRPGASPSASHRVPPTRFDAETVSFGSTPVDNPLLYPTRSRCIEIFDAACERYASAFRTLPDARLDEMITWGNIQIPIWASGLRLSFHNGTHCGQIADLRRALGMKSIFA